MYQLAGPITRVGMRYIPAVGRGLGTVLTYLGVDAAADFIADLVKSTGRSDWTMGNFSDKFGEFVGANPGRMIPIVEAAIRALGSEQVLAMLEGIDLSDYDDAERRQVRAIIDVLEETEHIVADSTGDGNLDTVWGEDKEEFEKNKLSNEVALGYVKTLCSFFGTPDDVRALREALFKIEDEHITLYEDMVKLIG